MEYGPRFLGKSAEDNDAIVAQWAAQLVGNKCRQKVLGALVRSQRSAARPPKA